MIDLSKLSECPAAVLAVEPPTIYIGVDYGRDDRSWAWGITSRGRIVQRRLRVHSPDRPAEIIRLDAARARRSGGAG